MIALITSILEAFQTLVKLFSKPVEQKIEEGQTEISNQIKKEEETGRP